MLYYIGKDQNLPACGFVVVSFEMKAGNASRGLDVKSVSAEVRCAACICKSSWSHETTLGRKG